MNTVRGHNVSMNMSNPIRSIALPGLALLLALLCTGLALAVKGDPEAAEQGWSLVANGALLVDVRSEEEYQSGHIEGAVNVPHTDTQALAEIIGTDKNQPVVLYCGSGRRAGLAQEALESLGYTAVFNASGYEAMDATRPQP